MEQHYEKKKPLLKNTNDEEACTLFKIQEIKVFGWNKRKA